MPGRSSLSYLRSTWRYLKLEYTFNIQAALKWEGWDEATATSSNRYIYSFTQVGRSYCNDDVSCRRFQCGRDGCRELHRYQLGRVIRFLRRQQLADKLVGCVVVGYVCSKPRFTLCFV